MDELMSWLPGMTPTLSVFLPQKKLGQFPRHGVGVSSYMTDLSNKQASKKRKRKRFSFGSKGGCLNLPNNPPPPPPPCVRARHQLPTHPLSFWQKCFTSNLLWCLIWFDFCIFQNICKYKWTDKYECSTKRLCIILNWKAWLHNKTIGRYWSFVIITWFWKEYNKVKLRENERCRRPSS